jgi:hypothetical protein
MNLVSADADLQFSQTARAYVQYWKHPSAPPKTFTFLRVVFERLGVEWVPNPSTYAPNSNVDSERYNFENMFSLINETQFKILMENDEIASAQQAEARSRLYRSIHKRDLFDHLMPAESRAYWRGTDRPIKFITCVVLTCVAYIFLTIAPSLVYGTLYPAQAFSETYPGAQAALIRDKTFSSRLHQLFSSKIDDKELHALPSGPTVEWFISAHAYAARLVDADTNSLDHLSDNSAWYLSSDIQKREATTFALFSEILKKDPARLEAFLDSSRIVVTPFNNILEIATQLTIILCTWMLLTLFFSRKIELFSVLMDCKPTERIFATIDCINVLGSLYRGRKHLHYLIAAFSATVATCIHFYYIGEANARIARPIAGLIGLYPYDYRLAIELAPIFITHWLLQFITIFMFVLLAWNVGILGRAVQRLQRHIAYAQMSNTDVNSAASATNQRISRYACSTIALAILFFLGWLKMAEAGVSFTFDGLPQVAYFFSPAYTVAGFLWFATPQMYSNFDLSRPRPRRKWTKEDGDYVEAALGKVPQLLSMIQTIHDLIHGSRV